MFGLPRPFRVALLLMFCSACSGDASDSSGRNADETGADAAGGADAGEDLSAPDFGADLAPDAGTDLAADASPDLTDLAPQEDVSLEDAAPDSGDAAESDVALDAASDTGETDATETGSDGGDDTDVADLTETGSDAGADTADGETDGGNPVVVEGEAMRCLANGWCWDLPLVGGADINDFWGASADAIWGVGGSGHIAYFDGSEWLAIESPVATELEAVHGTGPADIWAVGDDGEIIHFDGESWERSPSTVEVDLFGVWAWAEDDVWAVGGIGTALHWSGDRWRIVETGVINSLRAVSGYAPDDVWMVGSNAIILHHDGDGIDEIFEAGSSSTLYDVAAVADGECWAVGTGGWMRHQFLDAGSTTDTGPDTSRRIAALGPHDLWVVGEAGYFAHFDGFDWVDGNIEGSADLRAIWTDGETLRAGGRYGTRWDYDFDAESWAPGQSYLSADEIVDFAAGEGEIAYALTENAIHRRDGDGWSVVTAVSLDEPEAFWVAAADDIWVVGDDEALTRWNGATWLPVTFDAGGVTTYRGVWGLSAEDAYVAADEYLYHWDGDLWLPDPDIDLPVIEMFLLADETRYAVQAGTIYIWDEPWGWDRVDPPPAAPFFRTAEMGSDGRIYLTETDSVWVFDPESEEPWTEIDPPHFTVQGAWGNSPTDVWVLGDGDELRRFNGATWTAGVGLPTPVGLQMAAGPDALYAYSWAGHVLRYEP